MCCCNPTFARLQECSNKDNGHFLSEVHTKDEENTCFVSHIGEDVDTTVHEASNGGVKEGQQDVRHPGAGAAGASASDWLGPIKPDDKEELRQVWEQLKKTVEALPHVGCYSIASVAYRRQAQCPTLISWLKQLCGSI